MAFYTILSYIAIPFLILRLYIKSIKQPAYRERISERLALFRAPEQPILIWFHCVSLGEVIAAAPLIERLLKECGEQRIVLTTTTPTGSQKARDLFAGRLFHVYAPFDAPCMVRRFLDKIQPKVAIMMETEIWPHWFAVCKARNIPLLIANARLSEYSQRGYQRIKSLTADALACVEKVLAQTKEDAQRFVKLGVPAEKALVLGNIKFDLTVPANIHEKGRQFRLHWPQNRPVWIVASTHLGEEEIILDAFRLVKEDHPQGILLLVPRHPNRFDKVAEMAQNAGFNTILRTHLEQTSPHDCGRMDVLLCNTIGEMMLFLAASDVAFVGGSLIPQGGHNILEPAALYVPVITGPNMFNFQKIYDEFLQSESIVTVTDAASLAQAVSAFFADPLLREEHASLGYKIIENNQGALEKHWQVIRAYLS